MAKVNTRKIFLGLVLVALAIAGALGTFYMIEVKPELTKRQKTKIAKVDQRVAEIKQTNKQVAPSPAKKETPAKPKTSAKSEAPAKPAPQPVPEKKPAPPAQKPAVKPPPPPPPPQPAPKPAPPAPPPQDDKINLSKLVEEAKAVYGEGEQNRKEGYLWIDRTESKWVVTLGALQGVKAGSVLSVYSGNQKVGQVAVDNTLDVISYVHPLEKGPDQFTGDYYRVVIE